MDCYIPLSYLFLIILFIKNIVLTNGLRFFSAEAWAVCRTIWASDLISTTGLSWMEAGRPSTCQVTSEFQRALQKEGF